MTTTRTKIRDVLTAGATVIGVGIGGYGIAAATNSTAGQAAQPSEDSGELADADTPLTGDALDRATAAALAHTGGGQVTETEIGDDGAAYGVEILLDDGSQLEVNLDEDFQIISAEPDDD